MLCRYLVVGIVALGAAPASAATLIGQAYYEGGPHRSHASPAPNLRITAEASGHAVASTRTDRDGRFVFHLKAGTYRLVAHVIGSPTFGGCGIRTVRLKASTTTNAQLICGVP